MPKKKKVTVKPDKGPFAKGAALATTAWKENAWFKEGLSPQERGQMYLYLNNKGWEEIPERFTEDEQRVKQFNYAPQQKRGGKFPGGLFDE